MNYWAWGGKYIGRRNGDVLYFRTGEPIGRFFNDDLYDFSGHYLAEIKNDNRLIVNKSKIHSIRSMSSKPVKVCGTSCCDYVGYVMYAGYEDFDYN
mgnify:CR=1 FL=1